MAPCHPLITSWLFLPCCHCCLHLVCLSSTFISCHFKRPQQCLTKRNCILKTTTAAAVCAARRRRRTYELLPIVSDHCRSITQGTQALHDLQQSTPYSPM